MIKKNQEKNKIEKFSGQYRFLSNFYFSEIEYDGIIYPTVEHAFQSQKTLDIDLRKKISRIWNTGQAKKFGRKVKLRKDWEDIKLKVMEDLVRLKFSTYQTLKRQLIKTGNAELIESNNWFDYYWGVCNGKGQNNLGKILMKVRDEIIKEEKMKKEYERLKNQDPLFNEINFRRKFIW
jgi:ribA/ribD-fused uncharacterized protein